MRQFVICNENMCFYWRNSPDHLIKSLKISEMNNKNETVVICNENMFLLEKFARPLNKFNKIT